MSYFVESHIKLYQEKRRLFLTHHQNLKKYRELLQLVG